jgi:5-methyltetrahydropteroyltriglutamate--homocysteine methyltransferase
MAVPTRTQTTQRAVPRAEHVGSLVRPPALLDAHKATLGDRKVSDVYEVTDAGAPMSEARLGEMQEALIREVVDRQLQLGLDVVTDGEFRRPFFTASADAAFTGFQPSTEKIEFTGPNGAKLEAPARPVVAARVERIDNPLAREASFMASITDARIKVTLPAPSTYCWYGVFTPGITDKVYSDHDELADHITSLLRELVDGAIDAGANYVQFDYPFYPLFVNDAHRAKFAQFGLEDEEAYLERLLRVDAAVIEGLPSHVRTALHLCRGNAGAFWMSSGSLEPVADRLFALPYDSFIVEWDDKERDGDYSPLNHVPAGPIVALGIISTKRTELESADWVVRELEEASRYLEIDQLALAPQCGFGTVPGMETTSEDLQWRKLDLVARVADRVWPR